MVKAASLGADWDAIAVWSGRSARTVRHWLTRFTIGGIPALADAPRAGRPPAADAAYHAALDDLADRDPRAIGLPFDAWTSARLSAYLAETTGVRIAPSWLRALLIQHRFRCGRPKHTLDHLRDPDAVAACAAAIAEAEKKWRMRLSGMNCIIKMRRMSRPIPISPSKGIASGGSNGSRRWE